jgi:hypothetical protein
MDPSPSEKKKPPMKVDQKGNRNKSSIQSPQVTRSILDKERGGTPKKHLT